MTDILLAFCTGEVTRMEQLGEKYVRIIVSTHADSQLFPLVVTPDKAKTKFFIGQKVRINVVVNTGAECSK